MDPVIFILAPFVFLAYATEALTGFGAALVAVTLGALFYPIDLLVPVVVPLNVVVTGYISLRHRALIDRRLLFKQILPYMTLGIALGTLLFPLAKGLALKWLLGLLVMTFAGRQLWLMLSRREHDNPQLPYWAVALLQIAAGVTHAFYTTGGPLLVYSIGRLDLPKSVFRSTMCTVWATLNTIMIGVFVANGRINPTSLKLTAGLLLVLPLGILAGEWAHGRINQRQFGLFIYILLTFSGVALLFK